MLQGVLDKSTFVNAMYQLVDLWAEDRQVSYAVFMEWLFDNIAYWCTRDECWKFKLSASERSSTT